MIFNDALDANTSHTVLNVKAPVRLVCLGHAGIAPGIYKMEGDLRSKFITIADRRLLEVGLLTVTYHEAGAPTEAYVGKETPQPKAEIVTPELAEPEISIQSEEKANLVEETKDEGEAIKETFENISGDNEPVVILDDEKPKKSRGRPPKAKATEMKPIDEEAIV